MNKEIEPITAQAYRKADIVFITDGQAPVTQEFLADFIVLKKRREFKVFGVLVQSRDISTLQEFSDEIVRVDELVDVEAKVVLGI